MTSVRVYFLRDGKVAPVERTVAETKAVAAAALSELVKGPNADEARIGLSSALPAATHPPLQITSVVDGVAHVFGVVIGSGRPALAQVVYTLTQFASITSVESRGTKYTRGSFEDVAPAILVESPLPFATVQSPLRASETANTFEATFEYDLVDGDGKLVSHNFVTATSGSGTRGTFDFTVPFTVTQSGPGKLVVFESSAANGQRIHVVEIPLRLES